MNPQVHVQAVWFNRGRQERSYVYGEFSGVTRLQWARVQVFQKGPFFPQKLKKNSVGQILGPPQRWARVHCTPCTPYCYATDRTSLRQFAFDLPSLIRK